MVKIEINGFIAPAWKPVPQITAVEFTGPFAPVPQMTANALGPSVPQITALAQVLDVPQMTAKPSAN